jgi:hypothetical protein
MVVQLQKTTAKSRSSDRKPTVVKNQPKPAVEDAKQVEPKTEPKTEPKSESKTVKGTGGAKPNPY